MLILQHDVFFCYIKMFFCEITFVFSHTTLPNKITKQKLKTNLETILIKSFLYYKTH